MSKPNKSIRFDLWIFQKAIPFLGKNFAKFVCTAVQEKWQREGMDKKYQEWREAQHQNQAA